MATSNSRDFSLNRVNLIKRAFHLLNVYDLSDSIGSEDTDYASDMLNSMVKQWQIEGIHLWNRVEATLFTAYQTSSYSLSTSGTHATKAYNYTQLNGAHSSGVTTLTVDSTASMTVGDNIGIELTAGTRQWTTIATIPSSTSLTISAATTGAASDNGTIFAYTTKIDRPLQILSARVQDRTADTELPLLIESHAGYFDIPDKTLNSQPTLYYYDKQLGSGVFYLWPRPDNVDYIVNFTMYEQLEDLDSGTNTFDFPQEWTLALTFNLAVLLAFPYGKYAEMDKLIPLALELKQALQMWDTDSESIQLIPSHGGSRAPRT